VSSQIHLPVLIVMGEEDNVFCRTLVNCAGDGDAVARPSSRIVANEAPWYLNAASLAAYGVQNTGHDVTLQSPTAAFAAIQAWMNRTP
jgi:pimeloyl-ACP methyl ester carboxylesterase